MTHNQKTPRPSTIAYLGAALALAPLLAIAFTEGSSGLIADLVLDIEALAAAVGTLMAVAGGVSAWLGLDQPCKDIRCRRSRATIDCLNGKHDH